MNVQTVRFVNSSELFEGLSDLLEFFTNAEPSCTWGDNERSMVKRDIITEAIDDTIDDDYSYEEEPNVDEKRELLKGQFETLKERLGTLDEEILIDLES